jgi:hypothetical protein
MSDAYSEIIKLAEQYEGSAIAEDRLAACCLLTLAGAMAGGQLPVFQQLCAGFSRESLARIEHDKRRGEAA